MPTHARLTQEQLELLRERLEQERARLLRVLDSTTADAPSPDEQSELEEVAQRWTERRDQLGVADGERGLLEDVEHALARLRNGTYGFSESTGAPLTFERLEAVPWAREPAESSKAARKQRA